MSIPSYRIFYEYILESACRSAAVAACLSLSPSHCYQHARNPQYLFGADFQSKCNACEQKTSCGHSQPRRLRGLRLSVAWAAFASAPVAPSRLPPFGKKAGHEQAGWRNAIVLSPKLFNEATGFAAVCSVTNQRKGYPFEVGLPSEGIALEDGFPVTGVILADQVKTLDWKARNLKVLKHCD